jgi:hypothetical protein
MFKNIVSDLGDGGGGGTGGGIVEQAVKVDIVHALHTENSLFFIF